MPSSDELNAWIAAVATQGDSDAFIALFRHFAPRVKGYLMRAGMPAPVADDLAQEAMVTLWRQAASFDPRRGALSTWLYTIARNLRIDHCRQANVEFGAGRLELDHDVDVWDAQHQSADPQAGPDEIAQATQCKRDVHRALAQLPPEHAHLLQLSFFDDRSHAEMASELGIPLGTLKSRIRVAVAHLRLQMDRPAP